MDILRIRKGLGGGVPFKVSGLDVQHNSICNEVDYM